MKFRCLPFIFCAPAERCNGECWDLGNSVGWGGHGHIPVACLPTFMPLLLSQEPKNSLKSPKTSHLSTDGICWSWAISPKSLSSPWKDLTNTIFLVVDTLWWWLSLYCWASFGYEGVTEGLLNSSLDCSFHPSQIFWNCSWGFFVCC